MNHLDRFKLADMTSWRSMLLLGILLTSIASSIQAKSAFGDLGGTAVNQIQIGTRNMTAKIGEQVESKIIGGQYLLFLNNTSHSRSNLTTTITKPLPLTTSHLVSSFTANLTKKGQGVVQILQKYNTLKGLAIQISNQTNKLELSPQLQLSSVSHVIPAFANATHLVVKNVTLGDIAKIFVPKVVQTNLTLPQTHINATNIQAKNSTQVCDIILKNKEVKYCEPNRTLQLQSLHYVPSSLSRVAGYHNSSIGEMDLGNSSIVVGIMDSGVSPHPDLHLFNSTSFIKDGDLTDRCADGLGHGTHVAGIVGGKDNSFGGTVGIAPDIKLWSLKVVDCVKNPKDPSRNGSMAGLEKAIEFVTNHSHTLKVVNLSVGFPGPSPLLDESIHNSIAKGVIYVVAAGNGAGADHLAINASQWWPANAPGVIAVGAIADSDGKCGGLGPIMRVNYTDGGFVTQRDDSYAAFSNYGPKVTLAAPGVLINSTGTHGTYYLDSGTSEAAPYVAGAAADYLVSHSSATPSEVEKLLLNSAAKPGEKCDGLSHGYFTGEPRDTMIPLLYAKTMHPPN